MFPLEELTGTLPSQLNVTSLDHLSALVVPVYRQLNPVHNLLPNFSLRSILILSSDMCLSFPRNEYNAIGSHPL
jgi:hypothetical protein